MEYLFFVVYVVLGAVLWRFRGGGFIHTGSTQLARAVCGLGLALPLFALYGDPWLLLIAPATFMGLVFTGWGDFMDMGRTGGLSNELVSPLLSDLDPKTVLHDVIGMSLSGIVAIAPIGLTMFILNLPIWPIVVAGALFGPLYWMAWKIFDRLQTEYAEYAVGSVVATALYMSLVLA